MIGINLTKWINFLSIIATAFFVSYAGSYFFEWNKEFGLMVGLALGIWHSLYDLGFAILEEIDPEEIEEVKEK